MQPQRYMEWDGGKQAVYQVVISLQACVEPLRQSAEWWVGKKEDDPTGRDPDLTLLPSCLSQRARPVPRVSAFSGQPITRQGQGVASLFRASPDFLGPNVSR